MFVNFNMPNKLFIKELLNRRIPQIIGSYIIAGTSLVLFIDWLVARYDFPQYYVTLALFGIISILPSVIILAYFHGAPGKDEWTRIETIGIPTNILFIAVMLFIGFRYDFWQISPVIEEAFPDEIFFISNVRSNNEDLIILGDTLEVDGTTHLLSPISDEQIIMLNQEIISKTFPVLNNQFKYTTYSDIADQMAQEGRLPIEYDYRFQEKL